VLHRRLLRAPLDPRPQRRVTIPKRSILLQKLLEIV
jgi:hypothetical protein